MTGRPLAEGALEVLEANTQTAELDGRRYRFTVPSVRAYPFQWFWDSCFHAIVWARFDWRRAADELEGLLAWQHESGLIPHVVFWDRSRVSPLAWHHLESRGDGPIPFARPPRTTAGIQPPAIALAVERITEAGGGERYARAVLPALERYYRYLASARDPDGDGLVSVLSQFETGLDFSPAYDGPLARLTRDPLSIVVEARLTQVWNKLLRFDLERIFGRCQHHWEDVLVNAVYGDALGALARLARRAGAGALAGWASETAARVTAALVERCYDERRGFFFNVRGSGERRARPRTIQGLAPLLLPDLPAEVAAQLVDHLTSPAEFWLPFPVPLVARDEPAFTRGNRVFGIRLLSRGPCTMSLNWLVVRGLRAHGYGAVAERIAEQSRELVRRAGFNEFFDPVDGRPVGADRFGWATLAVDL